ncbi:MAG: CBS domain-containing protein [Myxococcales bacterium]|nr:CBS domain-containing protein [Myxococcales bacterium]
MASKLPTVSEYMDRFIYTVSPDMQILDAVDVLLEHRVTGVPVCDKSGTVVGMMTESDCLALVTKGHGAAPPSGKVADVMSEAHTVPPDMDVYFAAGLMLRTGYRRLVVVDSDGKLVGAVTKRDLMRVLRNLLDKEHMASRG